MKPSRDIARLIEIMAALRTPGSGCPWDLEQSFETIAPYTIEEAYEVADAIHRRGKLVPLLDTLRAALDSLPRTGRAEVEHVLSGPGLLNVHQLTHRGGECPIIEGVDPADAPARVSQAGLSGRCIVGRTQCLVQRR